MSKRALHDVQPASFAFSAEMKARAERIIAKYPAGRQQSAVIPLLDLAQRQEGWVTKPAIEVIAQMLGMAAIRVLEVATFYTMFNLAPVGKNHIQVCTSLSCWLRGSDDVLRACKDRLGIGLGDITPDGQFSLVEVECAGACVNAPVVAINDDYYEDVDGAGVWKIIEGVKHGERPKAGPINGRDASAPIGPALTLSEDPTQPIPKQDFAAAKAAFEKAKAEAAAKAAQPKT
jgi:NADH-quinone oxidoreductase E subunit